MIPFLHRAFFFFRLSDSDGYAEDGLFGSVLFLETNLYFLRLENLRVVVLPFKDCLVWPSEGCTSGVVSSF